ncbi:phospholipase [Microbacterium sp. SS28]|uniref:aggregation-promoting factor C-terminal-like domain-containing protein n=1 Tax=Microbacterium sp. SS28 TaxID=2919948 RepID=UPI001FA9E35A|nr:phospholipase [Microbacterium sp. SS28]
MLLMRPPRSARTTSRRPFESTGIAVGVVLGTAALVGLTAVSASASIPSTTGTGPLASSGAGLAMPIQSLAEIKADSEDTLGDARRALADAFSVTAAVEASGLDVGAVTSVDTSDLRDAITRLDDMDLLPLLLLPGVADDTADEADRVEAQTATLQGRLDEAYAAKQAADAAAAAQREAEAQAAAAAAAAAALAAANTPEGAKATAQQMIGEYGWGGDQFSCLEKLWTRESGWNYQAYNAGSGATGIPQSLPGNKMASVGADWQTNATTQIRWGLNYINGSYGSPCAAWAHSNATNWY